MSIKKTVTLFFCLFFSLANLEAQNNLTPAQILNKTVSLITNTKGVETDFVISNNGYTGKGSIKTSGNKFYVTLPDAQVWFNGKDLYTYNHNSKETTVVIPTSEELSESNPLAYVTNASKNYSVDFSTVKKAGRYVIELLPKLKQTEVKRVSLTVNKTNYHIEKIVVEPKNGSPISAEVSAFHTGISFPATTFEYPKTKFPKVEIIDLR